MPFPKGERSRSRPSLSLRRMPLIQSSYQSKKFQERAMTKAVRFHKTGGPEVLVYEDVTVGDPGEGQARVRNAAIGLDFIDTYHRSRLYPLALPSGLGLEGAGVVEVVGKGVTHV